MQIHRCLSWPIYSERTGRAYGVDTHIGWQTCSGRLTTMTATIKEDTESKNGTIRHPRNPCTEPSWVLVGSLSLASAGLVIALLAIALLAYRKHKLRRLLGCSLQRWACFTWIAFILCSNQNCGSPLWQQNLACSGWYLSLS
jgi:hypothetical protein